MTKTLITHNGGFHADDCFAAATLLLVYPDAKIIRTRDAEIIKTGDIVFDVGREYDGEKYFDHHQEGGAGARADGVPYAAFGLIWKNFGRNLTDEVAFDYIDQKLVETVDAIDNGVDISPDSKIKIFSISDALGCFNLTEEEGKENEERNLEAFLKAVSFAKNILERLLIEAKEYAQSVKDVKEAFAKAKDPRLLVLDNHIRKEAISIIPEVLYVVHPYHNLTWTLRATRLNEKSFQSRKPLPINWAGKSGEELEKITGVSGATFCHNGRFIANAKTKDGAIALAVLALES